MKELNPTGEHPPKAGWNLEAIKKNERSRSKTRGCGW